MPLSSHQSILLDCLVQARAVIGAENARTIFHKSYIVADKDLPRAVELDQNGWRIIPLDGLPEIEQREVMLWFIVVACEAYQLKGKWTSRVDLASQLGCLARNTRTISERWRMLAITRDVSQLPYSALESRPVCVVCSGRVATGAGWKPGESGYDTNVYGDYRPDVHHECKQYALRVIMPKLRARQAAARAAETAAVDK